jgi:hypothetical protein
MLLFSVVACKPGDAPDDAREVISGDTLADQDIEPDDEEKYLILDGQAGPFRIGDEIPGPATMMKYQMRVEQKTRHTEEGPVTETVTIIGENNDDLLWLKPGILTGTATYNSTISEIQIVSPKYKTDQGIGIGSTVSDFLEAYPEARLWYTYVSDMYVIETDDVKVQFVLSEADFTGVKPEVTSEISELQTSDFKADAQIKYIRIL